jgi:hypothetical protein
MISALFIDQQEKIFIASLFFGNIYCCLNGRKPAMYKNRLLVLTNQRNDTRNLQSPHNEIIIIC